MREEYDLMQDVREKKKNNEKIVEIAYNLW